MSMVASEEGGGSVGVMTAAAADKPVDGSPLDKKGQKKVPKKIHKAEREKLKRDQLNDLFTELGDMLEPDRQNNGKACMLGDTTRILRDLISQVESLRKENAALLTESHYVTVEKDELQDETNVLRTEILELQNQLRMRVSLDPVWSHNSAGPGVAVPHPTAAVFPMQHPQQPAIIEQPYASPPRELQLFPQAAPALERETSENQEPANYVTRPQPRYPTSADSWPVQFLPGLPRTEEECSSAVTGKEGRLDKA